MKCKLHPNIRSIHLLRGLMNIACSNSSDELQIVDMKIVLNNESK